MGALGQKEYDDGNGGESLKTDYCMCDHPEEAHNNI